MYTNKYGLSLSMAVWLASDKYDYSDDPKEISTTALIESPRSITLSRRITPTQEAVSDVSSVLKSSMGTAMHDSLENAWKTNYAASMLSLGYSREVVDRIKINPTHAELTPDTIPVYLEQRVKKQINGWWVSGKYDFIGDGQLEDLKTTGTYSYQKKTKHKQYSLQGSIYRWLNPDKITNDTMLIQYIFFNWEEYKSTKDTYPNFQVLAQPIPLLSLEAIEKYIVDKLALLDSLENTPEPELPLCTADELWQTDAVYAYYKNPAKRSKATKVFPTYYEAQNHLMKDGSCGVIVERPSAVKACAFCGVRNLCTQKDSYLASGLLIL